MSIGDVIDDVTRLYDVILVTSQSSKSSHSETGSGSTVRVDPFKHTLGLSYNTVLKISSFGSEEKAFGVTLTPSENCQQLVLLQFDGEEWVA